MGTSLRPLTMAQTVAKNLKEKILTNQIAGGEPLRQDAIAKSFGISIIPVREALRQLEAEGLVQLIPHRGAIATELTVDKALEWIHMRLLLEVDLLGRAMDVMTDEDADRAETVLSLYETNLKNRTHIEQWSDFNWDFHKALYAPANRPETLDILANLHKKSDCYVRLQLLDGDNVERAQSEHRELLDLYRARDKDGATKVLAEHIINVANDLTTNLPSSA
ncbi:transcription regulator [Kordiimonas sediminis]|uniref:Transcription regulator n=1 Tax=Kordiimonas sediminis TaxID=1735581 RepID=A0A919ALC1_9PROT|nr:GntR family transcriptional regulator [Kordiimonas sediminis]GHF13018.1 transcription regulator [Kordiimonas sediminis]